jgi:hypothetical protein
MIKAGTAEYIVAIIAARGAMAMAGNNASPSLLNAFPIRADIGTMPDKYRLVTRI